MRKFFFVVISFSLLFIILQSCDESSTIKPTVESKSDFPNSIGSYWVYEIYDSVRTTYDTMRVSITDTVTLPGISKFATKWTYEAETQYPATVFQYPELYYVLPDSMNGENDTIIVYSIAFDTLSWLNDIYVMPFDSGRYWLFDYYYFPPDSTAILGIEDLSVQAGEFKNVAHLKKRYHCGDECGGSYEYWFKEEIGLVKSIRRQNDLTEPEREIHAIWKLIDYHIQ